MFHIIADDRHSLHSILIDHDDGGLSLLCHLQQLLADAGIEGSTNDDKMGVAIFQTLHLFVIINGEALFSVYPLIFYTANLLYGIIHIIGGLGSDMVAYKATFI